MSFYKNLSGTVRQAFFWETISGIFQGLSAGMIYAFIPIIARKMSATSFQMAVLTSMPYIGGFLTLYWAHLSDRVGRKKFVVWPGILARSMFFLMLFIHTPLPFIIVVSMVYLLFSMAGPAYMGIMQKVYPAPYRGRLMGYVRFGIALMTILSNMLAGKLIETWGYQIIFPFGGLLGIMASITFNQIKYQETPSLARNRRFDFRDFLIILQKDKVFRYYSLSFMVFGFGNLMTDPLYPIFLVDQLKISNTMMGFLGASQSIFWMVSYYLWGKVLDKKYPLTILNNQFYLIMLVPFFYGLSYFTIHWLQNYFYSCILIFTAHAIIGIQSAGFDLSYMKSIMLLSPEDQIPKYTAIHNTLLALRGSIAPFVGTILYPLLGFPITFAIVGLFMLGGGLLMGQTRVYQRSITR